MRGLLTLIRTKRAQAKLARTIKARRESFEIMEFRKRRDASKRGWAKRREMTSDA